MRHFPYLHLAPHFPLYPIARKFCMFDYVRKNNKLLTGLMMLFIIPSFVFGGFEVYRRISGPGNGVASIDGQPISQQEWDEAHRHDVAQIRASQPDADAAMLDSPYVRYAALERLIEQRLIAAAIQKFHMQVSDQSVAQALMQIPEIAILRGADGKMDEAKYRQLLRENNKPPKTLKPLCAHNSRSSKYSRASAPAWAGSQPCSRKKCSGLCLSSVKCR